LRAHLNSTRAHSNGGACYSIGHVCYSIGHVCYSIGRACYSIGRACYSIGRACYLSVISLLFSCLWLWGWSGLFVLGAGGHVANGRGLWSRPRVRDRSGNPTGGEAQWSEAERSGDDEELQRKVTDLPDPRQGGTPKPSSSFFTTHSHLRREELYFTQSGL
jgi:hypothetical protein